MGIDSSPELGFVVAGVELCGGGALEMVFGDAAETTDVEGGVDGALLVAVKLTGSTGVLRDGSNVDDGPPE
jgi:hypothetical protein